MECFSCLIFFTLLCNIIPYSTQWLVDDTGCRTPDKEVGDCISIQSCKDMIDFLSKIDTKSLDGNSKKYQRGFFCGADAVGLKVCCPRTPFNFTNVIFSNSTTNNTSKYSSRRKKPQKCKIATQDEGTCITLESCHPVTNLISKLKNSFSQQRDAALEKYGCVHKDEETRARLCRSLIIFETAINVTENDEIKRALDLYRCGEDPKEQMVCCPEQTETDPMFHPNLKFLPYFDCVHNEVVDPNLHWMYGGRYAYLYEFPWMVALKYADKHRQGDQEDFRCGATLISKRYLLTAAHCVVTRHILLTGARLGEIDLKNTNNSEVRMFASQPEDFEITNEDVIVHPEYNPFKITNDIALIRLKKDVETSDSIRPICLPIRLESRNNKFEGKVTVTGWGETESGVRSTKLVKIDVPVVPHEECSNFYTNIKNITNKQICAGGKDGQDTCRGDSGGPLMTNTVLYGIVSFGPTRCAKENFPAVYTRVTSYLNWILDNMKP